MNQVLLEQVLHVYMPTSLPYQDGRCRSLANAPLGAGPGLLHRVAGPGLLHRVAGPGLLHRVAGPGLLHRVAGPGLLHRVAGPGLLHRVAGPGLLHRVAGPGLLHCVAGWLLHRVAGPGLLHRVAGPGLLHRVAGPGLLHCVAGWLLHILHVYRCQQPGNMQPAKFYLQHTFPDGRCTQMPVVLVCLWVRDFAMAITTNSRLFRNSPVYGSGFWFWLLFCAHFLSVWEVAKHSLHLLGPPTYSL